MALFSSSGISIEAVSVCVPQEIERTLEYEWITENERLLFQKTTGIEERRVANETTTCSDLCYTAAKKLLDELNCLNEIDVLIFVSQSPDYYLPATAITLQHRLGLSKSTMAFDVNLGCSGFIYGLSLANTYLQNPSFKKVLLLCGDKSTISTSYCDKSTYPLFGDAGSATLLSRSGKESNWYFNFYSDGSGKDAIIIKEGHSRNPYKWGEELDYFEVEPGVIRTNKHLSLDGMKVFNFALKEVAASIKELLDFSNTTIESVNYFVLHQANLLINESVRKKLKLDKDKFPISIRHFGNTSSASIPLTLVYALKKEICHPQKMLFSGFGVGLSWGNVLLETENIRTFFIEGTLHEK